MNSILNARNGLVAFIAIALAAVVLLVTVLVPLPLYNVAPLNQYGVVPLNQYGELAKPEDLESSVESSVDYPEPLVRDNNPPVFEKAVYTFTAPEDAEVGDVVGMVLATDPDAGDNVHYAITAGNDDGKFAISTPISRRIAVAAPLDYQAVASYTLTVEAKDPAGATGVATVTIRVTNDTADLVDRYDTNNNGVMEQDELLAVLADYHDGVITGSEATKLVDSLLSDPTPVPKGQKRTEAAPYLPPTIMPTAQPATETPGPTATTPSEESAREKELRTKPVYLHSTWKPVDMTEQEQEDVVNIVRASGVVERINGGQEWGPGRLAWSSLAGTTAGGLDVVWREPVDSSGPWSLIHCSGTIKVSSVENWRKITRLILWVVDMEAKVVAGFGVMSRKEDVPQPVLEPLEPDRKVNVYDVETGDIIYEGSRYNMPPLQAICAEGTYYRD